jgi:MFS family permease
MAAIKRGLWVLLIASFLVDLSASAVGLAVQFLAISLGAPTLLLGLYGTVGATVYGLGCFFIGQLSDRFSRRLSALFLCIGAAVWLCLGLQRSPYLILALIPFSAGCLSFFWPLVQAWIGDLVRDRRDLTVVLGSFNVLWTAGLMVGPVMCGYLWGLSHFMPFAAMAAIGWLVSASLMTVPTVSESRESELAEDASRFDPRADLYLPLAWLANFASWYAAGAARTLFPKLGNQLGFSEIVIGWVVFAMLAGQLLAFLGLRQATWWHFRRLPLMIGLAIGAFGMTASVWAHTPLSFGIAFAWVGAANGFTYVASLFYSLQAPQHLRGKRTGIHETIIGAGLATGPLVGGLVGQAYGLRAIFGVGAILFVAVLCLQFLLWANHKATSRRAA